jgi:hypothetical protein
MVGQEFTAGLVTFDSELSTINRDQTIPSVAMPCLVVEPGIVHAESRT